MTVPPPDVTDTLPEVEPEAELEALNVAIVDPRAPEIEPK